MDLAAAITAVLVFLAGQFLLKLTLEPAVRARETIVRARTTLDYYADVWANPPAPRTEPNARQNEASQALRRMGGELRTIPSSVLGYTLIRRLLSLPPREQLNVTATGFIGLSNNLYGSSSSALDHANRYGDQIKQAMHWNS